ncbi:lipopolysaccharide biosynthesis protein [Epilithonimonas hominis]|uniref:Membrane protein involved in the export of O-antigen and teichoic acid n=1 Tax=Epilithonimonas hominis TaxID=420404 RepID=A0A1H6I4K0_9FLAO|nr:lipopolysaccharide biosynthesis protein [Epilithonimonas hominis]SEH43385.1 Membrane protein involved in the export of O-antigen and teichoic acid [Epilithonimonas hominis]
MSVVARQGVKYSIIGYLGFLLGTFSAIFIFPYDMEFYGKLRYILPTAEIIVPIIVFGLSFSNVKFFAKVNADGKHHNMLSLSLLAVIINFLIVVGGFFLIAYWFPEFKKLEIWKMKNLILPLALVLALSSVFNKFLTNYKRVVVPNIFENFVPKLANLGAFCLFFFMGFAEKSAYGFFFMMFVISLFGYGLYTNRLEKVRFDFDLRYFKKDNFYREILTYSLFGFLGNIGNYIAIKIDSYMIGEFISFEENGIYNNIYSIISLIVVPQMGLFNLSAPIINKVLANGDYNELDRFHKKTSLSLFFLGLVLFCCIAVGFPYLADFMKNGEDLRSSEPIVWVLGFAMLFDLATGFNGHIISLSRYYKFNIVVMLILAVLTITTNMLFLKHTNLGILGIAIAYAISLSLFNIIKIIFNYIKFKVFPLGIEMMYAMILGCISINVALLLPDLKLNILNLFYKPAVVLIVLFIGNHFLKIYPLDKYLNQAFIKSLFRF